MDDITLIQGNCLAEMPKLPSASFDMICADLPYGTTACSWDVVIPFEPLWAEYKRLIKPRGAIVLFGSQPFTSLLVCSNLAWFRYAWVWKKNRGSNFANTNTQPMKEHEDVLTFSRDKHIYNPQRIQRSQSGRDRAAYPINPSNTGKREVLGGMLAKAVRNIDPLTRVPSSVLQFNTEVGFHPTQKPVALLEYLILTYTNEGDAVLDNTMGSGTTLVACIKTGRSGTGIELRRDYFEIAEGRVARAKFQPALLAPDAPQAVQVGMFDT